MKRDPIDPAYLNEIKQCVETLSKGDIILYPSDSLWGLGCDASNMEAIKKLDRIKKRPTNKSQISLVSSPGMLQNVVKEIPELAWQIIDLSAEPITIIYPEANPAFQHLTSENGKIAVRLVNKGFAHDLIQKFRKPITSTSANVSGSTTIIHPEDVEDEILINLGHSVQNLRFEMTNKPSKMMEIELDGRIKIIR